MSGQADSEDRLPADAVERIRASNDAWHRRDLEAALAVCSDDIEWDTTGAFLDGRVYRGMPAFRVYAEVVYERIRSRYPQVAPTPFDLRGKAEPVIARVLAIGD